VLVDTTENIIYIIQ